MATVGATPSQGPLTDVKARCSMPLRPSPEAQSDPGSDSTITGPADNPPETAEQVAFHSQVAHLRNSRTVSAGIRPSADPSDPSCQPSTLTDASAREPRLPGTQSAPGSPPFMRRCLTAAVHLFGLTHRELFAYAVLVSHCRAYVDGDHGTCRLLYQTWAIEAGVWKPRPGEPADRAAKRLQSAAREMRRIARRLKAAGLLFVRRRMRSADLLVFPPAQTGVVHPCLQKEDQRKSYHHSKSGQNGQNRRLGNCGSRQTWMLTRKAWTAWSCSTQSSSPAPRGQPGGPIVRSTPDACVTCRPAAGVSASTGITDPAQRPRRTTDERRASV